MYRVKFGSDYIVVQSEDLYRSVEALVRFVKEDGDIDVRDALRTIGYLKKYKPHDRAAIRLVKAAEEKLLRVINERNLDLW